MPEKELEEESLVRLISGLGETSTLHGIPRIFSSRQRIVKTLWCLLLLGTTCVFSYQLYELCDEYYSFPTKTRVKIKYAPIPFPAVTFCNMNPVKLSAVFDFIELDKIYFEAFLFEFEKYVFMFPEELIDDVTETHNSTRDKFTAWKNRFLTGVQNISKQERIKSGHQAKDFILSASFADRHISPSSFKTTFSHVYGNCFTLDTDDIIARGSGYDNSLYVVFNVEKSQYLEDFTSSYGVRLVLHEKGTYPLPAREGITLSTNYETHIGMRMTKISRLGGKYGNCTNGNDFKKKYNASYTVPICYSICETENLVSKCGCRPLTTPDFMNISERICDYEDDTGCFRNVKENILEGKIKCECQSRCEENVFTSSYSGRKWPHKRYLSKVLVKESCQRNITLPANICALFERDFVHFTNEQYENVVDNFLAVYIFFEDLNFEEIWEDPLYNPVRFLSDIGGAMGLYIGASALTIVEILQLLVEIILFLRRKKLISDQTRNQNS